MADFFGLPGINFFSSPWGGTPDAYPLGTLEGGVKAAFPLVGQFLTLNGILSAPTGVFPVTAAEFTFEYKNPQGVWTNLTSTLSSTQYRSTEYLFAVVESCRFFTFEPILVRCTIGLYDYEAGEYATWTSQVACVCAVPDSRSAYAYNGEPGAYRFRRLNSLGYV